MKRIIFAMALVMIFTTSFARKIAEGKTFSTAGNYRIEKSAAHVLNGTEFKTYRIFYANTPMNVEVAVVKEKGNKDFIVISDKLTVQYVCNRYYLGVKKLESTFKNEVTMATEKNLNRSEFFRQKKLCAGGKTDREAIRFIAAYFPFLINDFGFMASK
jgi:hypothetical protein